jgi:hypothetical protein
MNVSTLFNIQEKSGKMWKLRISVEKNIFYMKKEESRKKSIFILYEHCAEALKSSIIKFSTQIQMQKHKKNISQIIWMLSKFI